MADPRTDLGVMKIDTKGEQRPVVPFATAMRCRWATWCWRSAILQCRQDRDLGIVSARRAPDFRSDYQFCIRPMLPSIRAIRARPGHTDGKLGGINNRVYCAEAAAFSALGFAIPATWGAPGGGRSGRRLESGAPASVQLGWCRRQRKARHRADCLQPRLAKTAACVKDIYGGPLIQAGVNRARWCIRWTVRRWTIWQSLNYRTATHRPGGQA